MRRAREIDKQPESTAGSGNNHSSNGLRADAMWGAAAAGGRIGKSDEDFLQEILGPIDVGNKRPYYLHHGPPDGSSAARSSAGSTPTSHIKKRRRLLPEETATLVAAFEGSPKPSKETQDRLAAKLRMSPRAIQIWFQNRRAKARRDAAEAGKATLSFTPQPREPVPKAIAPGRRIEPAGLSQQERMRFEELFEMPSIPEPAFHPDAAVSIMLQPHSRQSSDSAVSAGMDAGTPLTWEDPAEWSRDGWGQWHAMAGTAPVESQHPSGPDWMDAFLES